jgi:molybdate transport system permease protein
MSSELVDWAAVRLTFALALSSTAVLLLIGIPLALWLARSRSRVATAVAAVVALPLVLPPTVLGFYLLLLLGPQGAVGRLWQTAGGEPLVFSFSGLLIGSVAYSLPFVVQPLENSFGAIDRRLLDAAASLGASPIDRFVSVVIPLSRTGLLTAITLGFAHTVGEFGVVLMIGGNIPGRTRVLSIAVYDHVESLEYAQAHTLSAGLLVFSFVVLVVVYGMNRRSRVLGA